MQLFLLSLNPPSMVLSPSQANLTFFLFWPFFPRVALLSPALLIHVFLLLRCWVIPVMSQA